MVSVCARVCVCVCVFGCACARVACAHLVCEVGGRLKRKPPADMFAIRHPFLESRPSFAGRRFHRARLLQCNMMRRSVRREGEPHFFTSSSAGRQAMDVEADTTEQGDDLEMSEDEGVRGCVALRGRGGL